jgi:hypothetical protein
MNATAQREVDALVKTLEETNVEAKAFNFKIRMHEEISISDLNMFADLEASRITCIHLLVIALAQLNT